MKQDEIARFYDLRGNAALESNLLGGIPPSLQRPYLYAYDYLGKHLKPGAKVLDFACGTGRHSIVLAEMGFDVLGIDLSPKSIAAAATLARSKGLQHCSFHCGSESSPYLHSMKFDAIFVSGALYYLDLEEFSSWFSEHLKPGGCLVAVETLASNPIMNIFRFFRNKFLDDRDYQTMYHLLRKRDFKRLGDTFGISNIRYFDFLTLLGRLLSRWKTVETAYVRIAAPIDDFLLNRMVHLAAFKVVLTATKRV
jgi:SAM-dependent methyltransferase